MGEFVGRDDLHSEPVTYWPFHPYLIKSCNIIPVAEDNAPFSLAATFARLATDGGICPFLHLNINFE